MSVNCEKQRLAPADVSVLPLSHWHNGTVFFLLQWMLTIWREWESEKCQHLTNDSFLPNIYCTNKPGSFTFLINLVNGTNRDTHRTNPKTCGFRCLYVYYKLLLFFFGSFLHSVMIFYIWMLFDTLSVCDRVYISRRTFDEFELKIKVQLYNVPECQLGDKHLQLN